MATSKSYFARQNYRFLSGDQPHYHHQCSHDSAAAMELEESDIYNNPVVVAAARSNSPEFRKAVHQSSRTARRADHHGDRNGGRPASVPVNIPDWSKILKDEYRRREVEVEDYGDDADDEDCFVGGVRVPPHELVARTRIASFSVHEGIGRTLKGRDLSRVRNAIWEKTGFQD